MPVILFRPHHTERIERRTRVTGIALAYAVFLLKVQVGTIILIVTYLLEYAAAYAVIDIGTVHNGQHLIREAHFLDKVKILLDRRPRFHHHHIRHHRQQVLPLRVDDGGAQQRTPAQQRIIHPSCRVGKVVAVQDDQVGVGNVPLNEPEHLLKHGREVTLVLAQVEEFGRISVHVIEVQAVPGGVGELFLRRVDEVIEYLRVRLVRRHDDYILPFCHPYAGGQKRESKREQRQNPFQTCHNILIINSEPLPSLLRSDMLPFIIST